MTRALLLLAAILAGACSTPRSTSVEARGDDLGRSATLVELACSLTEGMILDTRVAALVEGDPDDRRAVVVLETFDDLAGLSADMEELREGLRRGLLESGRFRVLEEGQPRADADFVIHGWLAPSEDRGRSWLVVRALTPQSRDEVWGRRLALFAGSRPGTFRSSKG